MNEEIEKLLKENTWASIKLNDFSNKSRHAVIVMNNNKIKDMVEKEVVIKALELIKQETIEFLNKLEDDVDTLQLHYANLEDCRKVDVIELIDKRIKQLSGTR